MILHPFFFAWVSRANPSAVEDRAVTVTRLPEPPSRNVARAVWGGGATSGDAA